MRYKYSAKTRDGLATRKSEIDAPDQSSALKRLQQEGLIVYSLIPVSKENDILSFLNRFFSINLNDKVRFTENLGSMMTAGLSLTKALEILLTQSTKKELQNSIQEMLNDVESGSQLSVALERQSKIFPPSYTSLIKAGEASGKLSEVMTRLAASLEKQREFRAKIVGALIYPIVITCAMAGVFVLLMIFVIPQMTETYRVYDVTLPLTTQIMIKISDFFVYYWYLLIIGIVAALAGIRYFYASPVGKELIDKLSLKIPLFNKLVKEVNVVQFTRTMSLLTSAGVPIIDGLTITRNTLGNTQYAQSIDRFIDDVKHGYPLSQSISKEDIYPSFVTQMVVVGEETGTVAERMDSIANFYEGEVDKVVKNLSVLIEPLIMIVLAIMVLFLIVSIILPIYQLTAEF